MKKLLTILFVFGLFSTVQAQTSRDEARRVILGGENNRTNRNGDVVYDRNGNPTYPNSSQQAEINRVNREYDAKIRSIQNNRNLSPEEKDRMIRQLERDRQQRIREINNRYGYGNDRYGRDDRDDRYGKNSGKKNKNYKNGNGKKKGWEIGKGNPHRTGQWPGNSGKNKRG